jgi:hypothetical protein
MKSKVDVVECLKTTPIIQVACQKSGISRATFYRWREQDEVFKQQIDQAQKEGVGLVNDLAESQLISLLKEKHPTAIFYWLNHHHPDYSDKRLYLSPIEQQLLLEAIGSNSQNAYEVLANKVTQGKIPRVFLSALSLLINRTAQSKENENNQKKIDLLSKINKL